MQPRRDASTVDDLLATVLDRGVVVRLDLVIGVAGIPLVGVNLHAAVAAIETMIEYGLFEEWDTTIRAEAAKERVRRLPTLAPGERKICALAGWCRQETGIWRSWQPSRVVLTDLRLTATGPLAGDTGLDVPVAAITAWRCDRVDTGAGGEVLHLADRAGRLFALRGEDLGELTGALRSQLSELGREPCELPAIGWEGRELIAEGRLWCRSSLAGAPRWRAGLARLSEEELGWTADIDSRELLRVPLADIWGVSVEPVDPGLPTPCGRDILRVSYGSGDERAEALLAGDGLTTWRSALRRAALNRG